MISQTILTRYIDEHLVKMMMLVCRIVSCSVVAVPAVVVCGDAVGEGGEEFPNSIYTTPDRPPLRLLC